MPRKSLFGLLLVIVAAASALVVDAAAGDPRLLPALKGKPAAATVTRAKLAPQHLYLVRSTLATLADANRTGNYSVLRDLGAPAFQARHSAADLAVAFSDLRQRASDLSVVLLADPAPATATETEAGLLRLAGAFAAPAQLLRYTLDFAPVAGHWRLVGLTVDVQPTTAPS